MAVIPGWPSLSRYADFSDDSFILVDLLGLSHLPGMQLSGVACYLGYGDVTVYAANRQSDA
jgi:hypothetical protein